MDRSLHKGSFLIVEGTRDQRVLTVLVHRTGCRITVASGKENALGALEILEEDRIPGVAALVDADFWKVEGIKSSSRNLFTTDAHDLEVEMFASTALERVLAEYGDDSKVEEFTKKVGKSVREVVFEAAQGVGHLRLLSERNGLDLNFRELNYSELLDSATLKLIDTKVVGAVLRATHMATSDLKRILGDLQLIGQKGYPRHHICCGHDLVSILFVGLHSVFGSASAKRLTEESLAGALRLGYHRDDFRTTKLYDNLKRWEKENPPYLLLEPTV